ncbi:hypothetical protein [Nocardioides aurantiacus]|nr:hypothetical protein [Nocardioides aurantiacus]
MGNPDDVRPTPAAELEVLLEQWVLDDGNYPQFKARRTKRFALQLDLADSHRLRPTPHEPIGACRTGGVATYEITADVVHHTAVEGLAEDDHAVVLDFGPRAYYSGHDPAIARLRVGDRVAFKATLLVDPYDYVEMLAPLEGFPALVHTWSVDRLQADHPAGSRDGWQDQPRTSENRR